MSRSRRMVLVASVALAAAGLRTMLLREAIASAQNIPPAADSAWAMAHFDHTPRHGGLVLMNGDTHFEVVLEDGDRFSVYFTSGIRAPLPASIASEVRVAVIPAGQARETIEMAVDATNARWVGRGTRIDDPNAIVRVGYTAAGTPYWIDVPASAWLNAPRSQ